MHKYMQKEAISDEAFQMIVLKIRTDEDLKDAQQGRVEYCALNRWHEKQLK